MQMKAPTTPDAVVWIGILDSLSIHPILLARAKVMTTFLFINQKELAGVVVGLHGMRSGEPRNRIKKAENIPRVNARII